MSSIKLRMACFLACMCALCVSCEINFVNYQDEEFDIETKSPHVIDSIWSFCDEHDHISIQFQKDGMVCKYTGSKVGAIGMHEEFFRVQWLSADRFKLCRADYDGVDACWYEGLITGDEMTLISRNIYESPLVLNKVIDE